MKIGIIGAGQMGTNYAKNLLALKVEASDIVCYDLVPERSQKLAQNFGIVASDSFPSGIDAAIVTTNTPSHHEVIAELARQGVKQILCEKPLAQNQKAVNIISDHIGNAQLYVGLVINFSLALNALIEKMETLDLELLDFYSQWGKNRGLLSETRPTAGDVEDEAVHAIGIFLMLARARGRTFSKALVSAHVGSLPYANEEVQAKAHAADKSFPLKPNHSTSANLELVKNGNKLSGSIRSSFLLAEEERMVGGVLGKRSNTDLYAFKIEFDRPNKEGKKDLDTLTLVEVAHGAKEVYPLSANKLGDLAKAFLYAALGGARDPRLATHAEGVGLVRIAEAILRSHDSSGYSTEVSL